jgi:ribosomal protein S18 acetylase RimI-like enzyme
MRIENVGLLTDLALLELKGSEITDRGDHLVVRTAANPTFRWGNFLLLGAAPSSDEIDGWVRRFEAEFPEAAHRTFGIVEPDADHSGWADRGYGVEVNVVLTATPSSVVGDGEPAVLTVLIRELVTDDDWQQTAGLGASEDDRDDLDARMTFERRRALAQRGLVEQHRAAWFGAFVGNRLVAKLGIAELAPFARYQDVITHADYRRQGIAGALVRRAAAWAAARPEVTTLVIVAEEDGPAIGLYRSRGFTQTGRTVGVDKEN